MLLTKQVAVFDFGKFIVYLRKKQIDMARFVNPFTDFGFKKLFGEEANGQLSFENIKFNHKQQNQYEKGLKYYRGLKNVTDTAFSESIEEGIEKLKNAKIFSNPRKTTKPLPTVGKGFCFNCVLFFW